MNFSTPDAVKSVIKNIVDAEKTRSKNRSLIQDLMNGLPPYTDEEAKENGIEVNINWKEGTNAIWNARRQFENAFLKPANYFTVNLDTKRHPAHRQTWSRNITKRLSKIMKSSREYMHLVRSKFAAVAIYGVGPQIWTDQDTWRPDFVAVEDLLIPTDCLCSFENLHYFAVKLEYTFGELVRKTYSAGRDPGWNMDMVRKIIKHLKDKDPGSSTTDFTEDPEKIAEVVKQNMSLYECDKSPTVKFYSFYHLEDDDGLGWHHKLVLVDPIDGVDTWVYSSRKPVAQSIDQILHVQFGDGNNKPPFLYHSVRSLGFLLYDVCQMMNRIRGLAAQHAHEQMMMLFRLHDPGDRERAKRILLSNNMVVEDGVDIVPREQRHQIDPHVLEMILAQYRQLIGEATASYTQQPDTGTSKEQTATETMAKVQQLNALMSSILSTAYSQEKFAYTEICRRFCNKGSRDKAVRRFQEQCKSDGIPDDMLNHDIWDIEPEQVLGGGNKMMEIAQSNQLMQWRSLYGSEAQNLILHLATEATTDNSRLADTLAPLDAAPHVTDAVHDAELSFGTLMQGTMVSAKDGINHIDVIETLLRLMGGVIIKIKKTTNVGTPDDVIGLGTVAQCISQHAMMLGQNQAEKGRVRSYMQALGNMMNEVKGFAQRQAQAAQKNQPQIDPDMMVKIKGKALADQQKLASKQASHAQKMQQSQQKFMAEEARKNAQAVSEIKRDNAIAVAETFNNSVSQASTIEAQPQSE